MFDPLSQNLDYKYLLDNGWTIPGNLAYRHILHDWSVNGKQISTERIEEIILQYNCFDESDNIKDSLQEFLDLVNDLRSLNL